ncbi:hypothetical protein O6V14_04750 [Sphingomonas faeni]|uniref:hypothetical protein n=1 Tax=Sphingomonas faeni TaxID=185950 RepID=UPI00334D870E
MATDTPINYPSAFPLNSTNDGTPGAFCPEPGMSIRDWFAGPIMMSIFDGIGPVGDFSREERDAAYLEAATEAYAAADAMLAARDPAPKPALDDEAFRANVDRSGF